MRLRLAHTIETAILAPRRPFFRGVTNESSLNVGRGKPGLAEVPRPVETGIPRSSQSWLSNGCPPFPSRSACDHHHRRQARLTRECFLNGVVKRYAPVHQDGPRSRPKAIETARRWLLEPN